MRAYDPLLIGELNIYNVSLALLTVIGLAVVGSLLLGAHRHPVAVPPVGPVGISLGAGPLLIGVLGFTWLAVAGPESGMPTRGAFYILPAAFVAAVGALSIVRPVHAGVVLACAAAGAFLLQILLGYSAGRIDPRWVADGMDKGSLAVMTILFSLPAMMTAIVLLTRGAPVFDARERAQL